MSAFLMTSELITEIGQAHSMEAGMSGVAYVRRVKFGPCHEVSPALFPRNPLLSAERAPSGERQTA